jgi:hypothetical protein
MSKDDEAPYQPPLLHGEDRPILYLADGTPLRRKIGFAMSQTGFTNPSLSDRTKKTIKHPISPKKGGKCK